MSNSPPAGGFQPCAGPPARPGLPLVVVACAVMIDPDGRILVATRPPGRDHAGLWEFPGGKLGPLESPEAALVRELAEELGIVTTPACLAPCGFASMADARLHLVLLAFALRRWQGPPAPREGQRIDWVAPPRLFDLAMPPADRALLGQIAAVV